MTKILVVVESPNKIAKISSFLGSNYKVEASYGIFRDLDKNNMSIDFNNKFEPLYVITKPDVVTKLKSSFKGVDILYIASDLDYEGENIAQSIYDVLKPTQYKRLIFNAITKDAILASIKNAGIINKQKVDAQKTRRVLDRLYGYLISPILQKKLGKGLSAGRVQSVTSRIVIDKENEISNFMDKNQDSSYYKTIAFFSNLKASLHKLSEKAQFSKNKLNGAACHINLHASSDDSKIDKNVKIFLEKCINSTFNVHHIEKKDATRSPAPPFTTSTLQQEANRKFGMSLETTMNTAQKLYEGGFITYMRTDSVEISSEGHEAIKKTILDKYGKQYYNKNVYKTKSESSQEAHEAIRPIHPELINLKKEINDEYQLKLYKLIWQRTIASQMANAKLKITIIQISISEYTKNKLIPVYYFQSSFDRIVFKGFTKVYTESSDDSEKQEDSDTDVDKNFEIGTKLIMTKVTCVQEYMKPPSRYTPASLVKKLEELGIGRPSTYVNTLKVIMDRDYVKIGDIVGVKKNSMEFTINKDSTKISQTSNEILLGAENKKLIPTNVGINVNTFLLTYFNEMMSYDFTAKVEKDMDEVASGNLIWSNVITDFYNKLKPMIEKAMDSSTSKVLGFDTNNNEISVTIAKYGPVVKKKLLNEKTKKLKYIYAKIKDPYTIETITLTQALELLQFPKLIGVYNENDIMLQKGENNYYIIYDHRNYAIDGDDVSLDDAITLIKQNEKTTYGKFDLVDGKNNLHAIVLKGPYGFYIQVIKNSKRENFPVPKNTDITTLTKSQVLEIIKTKKKPFKKQNVKSSSNQLKKKSITKTLKK